MDDRDGWRERVREIVQVARLHDDDDDDDICKKGFGIKYPKMFDMP